MSGIQGEGEEWDGRRNGQGKEWRKGREREREKSSESGLIRVTAWKGRKV